MGCATFSQVRRVSLVAGTLRPERKDLAIRQRTRRAEASEPPSDLVGLEFDGRYRIEARIGQGGIGAVYRATDTKLSSKVAVKVLLEAVGMRRSQRRRFEREAEALAAVTHPNVVAVLNFGVAEDTPYLVMELLEGESLSDLLGRASPLDPQRAMGLMRQLLAGLRYVHERGVVHRDLKPGNIFIQSRPGAAEQVKLLDFGLAKFLGAEGEVEDAPAAPTLTRSGEIFGTPGYMPAEQMLGKAVDARADVYSAAVILYEMLAGFRPYEGDMAAVVQQQLTGFVPRLVDAGTGRHACAALEALFGRALALTREERYRDAVELSEAFEALPAESVEQLSSEAREQLQRERHEASTRVGPTPGPTGTSNVLAAGGAVAAEGRRESASENHAPTTRTRKGLGWLVRSTLRASAFVIASISALLIVVAALVIYVFSQPDLERGRELLRSALPTDIHHGLDKLEAGAQAETARNPGEVRLQQDSAQDAVGAAVGTEARLGASVPARDPWQRRAPKALQQIRSSMLKGQSAGNKTISYLQRYNRDHQNDARGHLLLGGLYMNRGWLSDGVKQYKLAFQSDPSARGDAHALNDLLKLAGQDQDVWQEAAALLRNTYGPEVHDDIVRAARRTSQAEARARLMQLKTHIAN